MLLLSMVALFLISSSGCSSCKDGSSTMCFRATGSINKQAPSDSGSSIPKLPNDIDITVIPQVVIPF